MSIVRLCLFGAAFGLMMTACATVPYWRPGEWGDTSVTLRTLVGVSQILYLASGLIAGAVIGFGIPR
jgi:hypothetical protein